MSGVWIATAIAGVLTFLIRFSFVGLLGRWEPPRWVQRSLRFVPPAVLSAIVFPELLLREGHLAPLNPRLLAGVLAALVAWRTRSAVAAIAVGMGALLLVQALGG
jgi:branched-subunit amino acid transport protein